MTVGYTQNASERRETVVKDTTPGVGPRRTGKHLLLPDNRPEEWGGQNTAKEKTARTRGGSGGGSCAVAVAVAVAVLKGGSDTTQSVFWSEDGEHSLCSVTGFSSQEVLV